MKAESNVKLTDLEITVFIISWIAAIITNHKSEKYTGTGHGVSVRNVNSSLIKTFYNYWTSYTHGYWRVKPLLPQELGHSDSFCLLKDDARLRLSKLSQLKPLGKPFKS